MPKQVTPGRTRLELELPTPLVEAARAKVGVRGVSRLVGELLSGRLGVAYSPPIMGRPKKNPPPETPTKPGRRKKSPGKTTNGR